MMILVSEMVDGIHEVTAYAGLDDLMVHLSTTCGLPIDPQVPGQPGEIEIIWDGVRPLRFEALCEMRNVRVPISVDEIKASQQSNHSRIAFTAMLNDRLAEAEQETRHEGRDRL